MSLRNFIKRQMSWTLAAAAVLCARSAMAQIIINFDENGHGTVAVPGAVPQPLVSLGNITDPFDPTNGLKPLAYSLVGTIPNLVPIDGDINLIEPPAITPPNISDLLRFEHGLLVVYSDVDPSDIPPSLADVGIPALRQQNLRNLLEMGPESGPNGLFGYTPNAGDPGVLPAAIGAAVYNFTSDPPPVPEPATAGLLIVGGCAMLLRRRRR